MHFVSVNWYNLGPRQRSATAKHDGIERHVSGAELPGDEWTGGPATCLT